MKPNTRSFYVQAVGKALEAIATHLDDALELEALAASAGLSPFHFHRVFRGMVGETPMELARRLRLERAAFQLVSTELSVTQLAFAAGYETHEAFTRAFRAHYGLSPSDYRRRREARIALAAPSGVHFGAEGIDVTFHPQDTGGSQMHVEITHQPRLRVATVRHVGPYNRISEAFGRLGALAGPAGLFNHEGARMIALYHDDPDTVPVEQLRSDAGLVVPADVPLPEGVEEQFLPEGRYAHTLHVGSYEHLGDIWARFMGQWLPNSGERMSSAGAAYEHYVNDPSQVPAAELRTELYLPLA